MKSIRALVILLISIGMSLSAQSVLPGAITNNVSPSFTTVDGLLTVTGFSDSASTVPANLGSGGVGTWFGVGGDAALTGTETMILQLAPGAALTGFGDIWTRAVISISGFAADPGLTVGSNPGVLGSSYSAGLLTLNLDWNGGGVRDFTLSNPFASAGQLLTISLDFATSPQWAITHFDYAPVPEPSSVALFVLGAGAILFRTRRLRI